MAIKVVEDTNIIEGGAKFKATCPKCGATIEYLGRDVSIHRNFPKGYVYCPKCRNPIAHDKENFTGEVVDVAKEDKKVVTTAAIVVGVLIAIIVIVIVILFATRVIR